MTFLVRFGFQPGWVLSRDVLTFNALYASAMRCHYEDRIEDAHLLVAAVAQGSGSLKKGTKPPVAAMVKAWQKIVDPKKAGAAGPQELLRDMKVGFETLLPENVRQRLPKKKG